jgi:hypothetical protein
MGNFGALDLGDIAPAAGAHRIIIIERGVSARALCQCNQSRTLLSSTASTDQKKITSNSGGERVMDVVGKLTDNCERRSPFEAF